MLNQPTPTTHQDAIIVPRSAFDSDNNFSLIQANVNFVNAAIHEGYFRREELPQNAMRSFHLDYYMAQVSNGGHGQFLGNNTGGAQTVKDVNQALSLIGLAESYRIFRAFLTFLKADPKRAKAVKKGGGFGMSWPELEDLDKRYYASSDALRVAHRDWLASLPELKVVSDQNYKEEMQGLLESNPMVAERKQSRANTLREAFEKDPLNQAFSYMCGLLKPPIPYEKWVQAQPVSDGSPGSVPALKFAIRTSAGLLAIVIDIRRAVVFEDGPNPRILAHSDIEPLCEHVLQKTGIGLLGYLAAMRGGN
ncbi:MAG: DUF4375 domain-containing protein [Pseudomonadota bacterium]